MLTYLTDAIAACEAALNQHSDHQHSDQPEQSSAFAAACRHLSHLLQGLGKFEEAVSWHTWAMQAQPDRAAVYANLGNLYVEQGRWQQAIAVYKNALQHNPDCAIAYWGVAQILSQNGKRAEAVEYWDRAVTLEPHKANAEGYVNLGNALLEQGNADRAIERYLQAVRLDPHLPAAYNNLGEVLIAQGRWQQAIACYRRAIAQTSNPAWAYYKLGNLLLDQGELDAAATAFEQSIQLNPDYPWAYHNLVEALQRQGKWTESIAVSQAVLDRNRDYPWAYTHLGRAFIATGQETAAIAHHQKACELRGWHQCIENGYQFTQDWFTHNIPLWQHHLAALMHQPGINFLEIGSYQGMSTCWLLDSVLTHPWAKITCIDPNYQPAFASNITKTGAVNKVTQLTGNSHAILPTLASDSYDVIYIDGCHLAAHVQQDAILSWERLKPGGLMIFDDYEWIDPGYPGQDPKLGIDAFLATVQDQIEVLHQAYQIIIRRVIRETP